VANHKNLQETETFKKLKHVLKKHDQRKLWITLTGVLRTDYLDKEDNLQFKKYFLEEEKTEATQSAKHKGISEEAL